MFINQFRFMILFVHRNHFDPGWYQAIIHDLDVVSVHDVDEFTVFIIKYPAYIGYRVSTDNGTTWGNFTQVAYSDSNYIRTCNKPIVLNTGRVLLPVYNNGGVLTSNSTVYYSDDNMSTWSEGGHVNIAGKCLDEPTIVQTADNNITMLMRDSTSGNFLWQSISSDYGITWSTPVASVITSPQARSHLLKLKNNDILLIWNDISSATGSPRLPYTAAILNSTATGITFKRDLITTGIATYSNGDLIQKSNGDLVVFTSYSNTTADSFHDFWVYSMVLQEEDLKIGIKNQWTKTGAPTLTYGTIAAGSTGLLFSQTGTSQYINSTGKTYGNNFSITQYSATKEVGADKGRVPFGFGAYGLGGANGPFSVMIIDSSSAATAGLYVGSGSATTFGADVTDNTNWHTDEIQRTPSNNTHVRDGSKIVSVTTNTPTGALPVSIGGVTYGTFVMNSYVKYIFSRPFVTPEPAHGDWQAEQAIVTAPTANFTANQTTGTTPLNVSFTDSSTNTPTSWYWEFGDGNNTTSQNPTHVYYTGQLVCEYVCYE